MLDANQARNKTVESINKNGSPTQQKIDKYLPLVLKRISDKVEEGYYEVNITWEGIYTDSLTTRRLPYPGNGDIDGNTQNGINYKLESLGYKVTKDCALDGVKVYWGWDRTR